jgi:hypothetical protein
LINQQKIGSYNITRETENAALGIEEDAAAARVEVRVNSGDLACLRHIEVPVGEGQVESFYCRDLTLSIVSIVESDIVQTCGMVGQSEHVFDEDDDRFLMHYNSLTVISHYFFKLINIHYY